MGESQKKRLTGVAIIVMSSIIISRISGYLREMLVFNEITTKMGTEISDAFNMAFSITDVMYNMLVGGTIAAAIIPVLSGYIEKKEEKEGWKAVGTFINIIFLTMLAACTLGIVFAPQIVPVIAGDFNGTSSEVTIRLVRILFPSVAFMMLSGLTNGVLNSYQRFAAAAYGPTLYNLGGVLSIYFLSRYGIDAVTYGVLASSIFYFLFQFSFAFKNFKHFRLKIHIKNPGFIRLFKLAIPSLASSSIVQVNTLITVSFTSGFDPGSVTALSMANKLWQMPLGIIAQGIGTVILPSLSARVAVGELTRFKELLTKSLKSVLFLSIPAAAGFIVLSGPIIRTLCKFRKDVPEEIVISAASILTFFSLALIAQSICAIMNRAFYANNNTKTPLYIGSSSIILNLVLSQLLRSTFLGVSGMALSYSLVSTLNAVLLIVVLNRSMRSAKLEGLTAFFLKTGLAALIMAFVLYPVNMLMPFATSPKLLQLAYLGFDVVIGAGVYFGVSLLFKLDEAVYMRDTIMGKIRGLQRILRK